MGQHKAKIGASLRNNIGPTSAKMWATWADITWPQQQLHKADNDNNNNHNNNKAKITTTLRQHRANIGQDVGYLGRHTGHRLGTTTTTRTTNNNKNNNNNHNNNNNDNDNDNDNNNNKTTTPGYDNNNHQTTTTTSGQDRGKPAPK